jgi:spore coat polysaccharide biosynthesis protein SpsF
MEGLYAGEKISSRSAISVEIFPAMGLVMRTVTVIQARTGSSRLPGKIMYPVLGRPLLIHMVDRVRHAQRCGIVVVATTVLREDDVIVDLCERYGIPVLTGHPTDLLDRHFQVAAEYDADAVVKIPSDCPLIDPAVIDRVIRHFESGSFDYVSNLHPATYPDGNDVEIMSMRALETAWKKAVRPMEREHTTPFFWENPSMFRLGNVEWETGLDYSMSHRWTLDYEEDLVLIRAVIEKLAPTLPAFTMQDILSLLSREPEMAHINARYAGVNWYRHHLDELRTIHHHQTRHAPAV